jgi:PAS domain S-box-containing protein
MELAPDPNPQSVPAGLQQTRFPWRTTAVMVVLTFGLLALAASHTWSSYRGQRDLLQRDLVLGARMQTVLSDASTLDLLARTGIDTGRADLREQHQRFARGLELALQDLRALAPDGATAQLASRMAQTAASLRAAEALALAQRASGDGAAARAALLAADYQSAYRAFAEDSQTMQAVLVSLRESRLAGERRRAVLVVASSALALPVVVAIWVAVLARMRTYVRQGRRATEASRESEQRYRALFESNPLPMWVYDPESLAILAVNGASVERYGYTREEFLGLTLRELRVPADVHYLQQQMEKIHSGEDHGLQTVRHRTKFGDVLEVEVRGRAIHFGGRRARLVTLHDVTERKVLEEQFRQAQKMEAVGRLAGGVAHDFNNILNVILGYAELTLRTVEEGDRRRRNLLEIRKAAEHAAALTRQLLAFGRGQVLQPRVLDLNAALAEIGRMVRRLIGEDVELVTTPGADLGRVKADPAQLTQVVLNLAVNARDAMPEGGTLTIETANVDLDGRSEGLPAGPYVLLSVTDTGCGIPQNIQEHIFEPFFTTKEKDKGTGLGLATVYGIVKQSGGAITVESEPGAGSTFRIYLPRVEAAVAEAVPAAPVRFEPARASETVLLVEDDAAVRGLTREVLEESGYRVLEAPGGFEALELAQAFDGRIDLLLTDVVMPRMNGRELARRLHAIRPATKALYMSGYAPGAIVNQGVLEPGLAFIAKPLRPAELTRKVREVLDGSPAEATRDDVARVIRA